MDSIHIASGAFARAAVRETGVLPVLAMRACGRVVPSWFVTVLRGAWIATPDAMTCACVACNPITRRYPVGACGVVEHYGISCVRSWLVCGW